MNKLLSTPLAVAVSAAFVVTVSLSSCATNPTKETTASEQNLTPEEAAQAAAEKEKKRAAERKRERAREGQRSQQIPSGSCSH